MTASRRLAAMLGGCGVMVLLLVLAPAGAAPGAFAQDAPATAHVALIPAIASDGPPPAPPQMETETIGTSVQGRSINVSRIGNGDRHVVLIGGLHAGTELETVEIVEGLREHYRNNPLEFPASLTLHFVAAANPDAVAADSRLNANGVDLNRNFPADDWRPDAIGPGGAESGGSAPLSEPETAALFEYLLDLQPDMVISWHGYAAITEANDHPRAVTMAQLYAVAAEYTYLEEWEFYEITGQLIDALDEEGIAAFDLELDYGDPSAHDRNLHAVRLVLDALGGDEDGDANAPAEAAAGDADPAVVMVLRTGSCLDVREEHSATAATVGCYPDGVVLRDRAEFREADGVMWQLAGRCDVENVLFYNVGVSAFRGCSVPVVRFGREMGPCPSTPEGEQWPHYVRYALEPAEPHDGHVPIVRMQGSFLASARSLMNPWLVWRSMKLGEVSWEGQPSIREFGLDIIVTVPEGRSVHPVAIMKTVVDGVIGALHAHDGSALDDVSTRVALPLAIDRRDVAEMLMDQSSAILGTRRLLWPFRNGVQMNPADDLLQECSIEVRPTPDGSVRVMAELFPRPSLTPRPPPP